MRAARVQQCYFVLFATTTLLLISCVVVGGVQVDSIATGGQPRYDCEPCIDRSTYHVEVLTHAFQSNPFWEILRPAAIQAGNDMGVQVNFDVPESYDVNDLRQRFQSAIESDPPPDAMVVSLPSEDLIPLVEEAAAKGIPVFGMNSGYNFASELREKGALLAFVAQDEFLAGQDAGKTFLVTNPGGIKKAVYVKHEQGNVGLESRQQGFEEALTAADANATVSVVLVDLEQPESTSQMIMDSLGSCDYDAVLLSTYAMLDDVIKAYEGCGAPKPYSIGTFDVDKHVYEAIASDEVIFAVDQEPYLQGAFPVVMAALYATTGRVVAPPMDNEFGIYLSGPKIVTKDKVPSEMTQDCISEAFPVCPNTLAGDGQEAEFPCTDRSMLKIVGITHGPTDDIFWDLPYAAANQAGDDFGVDLELKRYDAGMTSSEINALMYTDIEDYCGSGIDAIFVTFPTSNLTTAVQTCLDADIKVIAINAGIDVAEELSVQFIGQNETEAGYEGASRIIEAGATRLICPVHVPNNTVLEERCSGYQAAIDDANAGGANVVSLGSPVVPLDDPDGYVTIIEALVGDDGDWEGIGVLAAGEPQATGVLEVKSAHPEIIAGNIDVDTSIYAAIAGELIFGTDQQAYVQGYYPVPLLVWALLNIKPFNDVVLSGPKFVDSAPSDDALVCERNEYEVCGDSDTSGASTVFLALSTVIHVLLAGISALLFVMT